MLFFIGKDKLVAFLYGVIATLLLLCLFDMPFGFYTFVRFAAAAAFCYFAYKSYNSCDKDMMILFIVLAILFQPFVKIPLGRIIWNIVDVAIAVLLIYLIVEVLKKNK